MKRSLTILLVVALLICLCAVMFTGCQSQGTYEYSGVLNIDAYVKLGSFSKATVKFKYSDYSYDFEGKYKIGEEDKDGNKSVTFTYKENGKEKTITDAYMDEDGALWLFSIYKFEK